MGRPRRTGTLWEGRFKSRLVDSERYLLAVRRYIELNPVRAAMTAAPEHYRWSNAPASLGLADDPIVTPHPAYLAMGPDSARRSQRYQEWSDQALADDGLQAIRAHLRQERALGAACRRQAPGTAAGGRGGQSGFRPKRSQRKFPLKTDIPSGPFLLIQSPLPAPVRGK